MQIEVDSRDNEVVYTGYQFGWYMRTDRTTGERASLPHAQPGAHCGGTGKRPSCSAHPEDVFYMASNSAPPSLDREDTFDTRSDDLTRGGLP